jgi:pyocin large subunit-like protein
MPDFRLWRKGKLRQHFDKHGADFGAATKEEYSILAKEFAEQPLAGNDLIDFVDGSYVYRVDRAINTILVATRKGVLKMFYKWDGRPDDVVVQTLVKEGLW